MRIVFAVCLTVMNAVAASAQPAVQCVDDLRTTNNCYKLYEPRQKPRGLLVLLPATATRSSRSRRTSSRRSWSSTRFAR